VLFCTQSFGQLSADSIQLIDKMFSRYNNATPGVSVAVERNGKLIYHKSFGLADLEHNVPNTTATIFEAGSVSKQFTAAAILLLNRMGNSPWMMISGNMCPKSRSMTRQSPSGTS